MAFVLADPFADGLEGLAQGTGGFAFTFPRVDLDAFNTDISGAFVLMGPHL